MRRHYNLAPLARADLDNIYEYVAKDKPLAAKRLVAELKSQFRRLAGDRFAGEARHELGVNLRSFSVGNYVIFYRPVADGVEIVRVIHGARDWKAMF